MSRSTRGTSPSFAEEALPLIVDFPVVACALRDRRTKFLPDVLPNQVEGFLDLADRHAEGRGQLRIGRRLGAAAEGEGFVEAEAGLLSRADAAVTAPAHPLLPALSGP